MNRLSTSPALQPAPLGRATLLTLLAAALLLLPFLGTALFYTKGEPREAIVAVSMLQTGDWVLPVSNGDVIPYKPPMLAWLIALLSLLLNGGVVSEYISRLPSALALVALTVWTLRFFGRNAAAGRERAAGAAMVMLTAFEVYRAGMACRVDMLLTLFMVGSLYALFGWWRRGLRGVPVVAGAMMAGAMLTKGPVGVLLPCAVAGAFMLLRGERLWPVAWRLAALALGAAALPMVWYVAAYARGGDEFLRLALEENVGRLTGTMSYDSHVNPVWYNFMTVALGMLPYTLLMLFSLFSLRRARVRLRVRGFWGRLRAMDAAELFALVAVVVVFVFYCLPKSKRSVYLLPIYPFLAWWVASWAMRLARVGSRAVGAYLWTTCVAALAAYAAYVVVQCGGFPFGALHGKHALEQAMMVVSLRDSAGVAQWACVSLAAVAAVAALALWRRPARRAWPAAVAVVWSLYVAFGGALQPGIINAKSDKPIADYVAREQPSATVYAHVATPMLRFFSVDFYLGDRVKPFELAASAPGAGLLLIGVDDARTWLPAHADDYEFTLVKHFRKRSCDLRQEVLLLRFARKNGPSGAPCNASRNASCNANPM